ncbi:sulfur carrier protein ThiS adenylyltransferase ThiF [Anaerococcus hydrogenalis]|uniref:sulfur carrier protein ThiS adenylyltransferase ThiF n=1 Tax=Anaerococcus hydrogenalis TaxID=33029 RepID=UPI001DAFBFD0|nr:sulfur carrier protein ThiS adenylyltransferase ThiF [Anaerococcus hydrogenalis]MBS5988769.1 sulfur carrier protein ThiS adenylyltransferase ThiF [Anaerococcus hydrogenalis]
MDLRDKILKRQNKKDNEIFKNSKVSILGCGGLGSNVAMILARAGIGEIYLYDFDKVEYSNLNRQNYKISDIGKEKVLATKKIIEETIPYTNVHARNMYLDEKNMDEIVENKDYFIEAFDNKESKVMAFDYFSKKENKFLFTASGMAGLGDISDIKVKKINNITMVGDFKSDAQKDGLYLAYVSIMASLEALECLKKIRKDYYGR